MTITGRIRERGINAVLIGLLFVGTGFGSCFAQSKDFSARPGTDSVQNDVDKIRLTANLNLNAVAISVNPAVNSTFEERKPTVAPHGKRLYFSRSNHPRNSGGVEDLEDIWYTEYDSVSALWSEPILLPGKLNNAGPNFIGGISVTGDTIFLGNQYKKNGKMRNGLSYAVNVKGTFSDPIPFPVKNDYNISQHENAFVSLKAGVIISAVQRVDTQGDRDLYVSFWNGKTGTEPVNMGMAINSELEESSPYLAADTKTLYFASKGHHGYGGYDIFVTRRLDETWTNWTTPENLGPAVNGAMDDEYFTISVCKKFAFFSKQISEHNVDIFRIPVAELFNLPAGEKTKAVNVKNIAKDKNGKETKATVSSLTTL